MICLDRIDPKFRLLTDLIFFTDRLDLDTSSYKALLNNKDYHFDYFWDRFSRSCEIFWDESFWIDRFEFLLSLSSKRIENDIENMLLNKFKNLLMITYDATPTYHNSYIHFLAWTKAKVSRKENLTHIRKLLVALPTFVQASRISNIITNFIPCLFLDISEYTDLLSVEVANSARSFEIIKELEKQGISINKDRLYKTACSLLFKRVPNKSNRRSFFAMINDSSIMSHLKLQYQTDHRIRLLGLINSCGYKEIEEYHLRNVKNLLHLDYSIADDLMIVYAESLHKRRAGHKRANIQRLIRLCKTYPQFSTKKLLVFLSDKSRMSDIKFLVKAFPDLKTLVPFI